MTPTQATNLGREYIRTHENAAKDFGAFIVNTWDIFRKMNWTWSYGAHEHVPDLHEIIDRTVLNLGFALEEFYPTPNVVSAVLHGRRHVNDCESGRIHVFACQFGNDEMNLNELDVYFTIKP